MVLGVDRSHHNSKVSLASLVTKGVKFIWFKATEGETYVDKTFNNSWQEAKAIPGLARGCYHFFNPQVDGVVQAKHYLSTGVNFSGTGCLPPCVDVEDLVGYDENGHIDEAETKKLNKWVADNYNIAISRLNDFLAYIKEHTGRDCIIYTYNNYPKEYFHGHGFSDNEMWISSLQKICPVRYDTKQQPLFWQNTYNWYGTQMDGNYFTGTQEQLNLLSNIKP